ncbi:MAG: hypothetical protein IPI23_05450 [Bacteroidetes bacterium]|nr:hypothetical protein [Bacteroidota bacterium]
MKTKLNFALMLVLLATTTLFNACKDDDDDNPTTPTPTVAPKLTIDQVLCIKYRICKN